MHIAYTHSSSERPKVYNGIYSECVCISFLLERVHVAMLLIIIIYLFFWGLRGENRIISQIQLVLLVALKRAIGAEEDRQP